MIPEPSDRRDTDDAAAGGPGDTAREIDELTFLIGTSCGRTITLLMQSETERAGLRDELEFLAEKAGRLAALLAAVEGAAPSSV